MHGSFTCMLIKPVYMRLVAQVVRAPVQCFEGCEQHNLAVCLPADLSIHLPMTVCLAVSVHCSFYLFCRPVLLDYLVVQVVRVPDPIRDTFIQHLLFSPKNLRNIRHTQKYFKI